MSKQFLLSRITAALDGLSIPYQTGGNADITIFKEFLDAGWSTGNKKITYNASVFADESTNTVYMWELTKETGSGFSAGFSGSTTFQSGKTLYRKVKSVQYGPDGKAYDFTFDIGAIPKAVKDAATAQNWKFKTVISKGKASYPKGYTGAPPTPMTHCEKAVSKTFCTNCGAALDTGAGFCPYCGQSATGTVATVFPQQSPGNAETHEKRRKPSKLVNVLLAISGVLIFVFFLLMGVPWLSWLFAIAVMGGFFLIARKLAATKTPLVIVLWVVAMVIVFIVLAVSISNMASADANMDVAPAFQSMNAI